MLPPAESFAFTADCTVFTGAGVLRGWSIINASTDTGESVFFYDSADTTKLRRVANVLCPFGQDRQQNPNGPGIYLERGLTLDVTGGDLTGVVYFNVADRLDHDLLRWDYASRFEFPDSLRSLIAIAGVT